MKFVTVLLVACVPLSTWALGSTGKVMKKGTQEVLFHYQNQPSDEGPNRSVRNVYKDAEGKEVVAEDVKFANDQLAKYVLHQNQLKYRIELEVKDGKAVIKKYDENGKVLDDTTKDFAANTILGPTMISYLRKNWSDLKSGKKVTADFIAVERLNNYEFEYFKDKEEMVDGQKQIVIKMKIASLIASALVDPLYLRFSEDGSKLISITGRTVLKQKVKNQFKDLDAETVYTEI